jgi:hypothetical protein
MRDLKRVRLCIWEGKKGCVFQVGLPQPVAVLPWDIEPWESFPTAGYLKAPAHPSGLSGARPKPFMDAAAQRLAGNKKRSQAAHPPTQEQFTTA